MFKEEINRSARIDVVCYDIADYLEYHIRVRGFAPGPSRDDFINEYFEGLKEHIVSMLKDCKEGVKEP